MMYVERVGRRTLICAAIIGLAGVFYLARAHAADGVQFADPPRLADTKQPGRFQIYMHPQFRGDQYLLDTMTGQVWQLVKFSSLDGEPLAWKAMTKIDNDADMRAFLSSHSLSVPDVPAKQPKAATGPQKLTPLQLR